MIRRVHLPRSRRGRWILVVALVVVLVAATLLAWRLTRDEDTRFEAALALAPESTQRISWTDWSAVRTEVGAALTATSSTDELDDFLLAAFDRDLTATTALEESAPTLQTTFGFSPATIDWELFAQGEAGAVVILGMPEGYDFDGLRDRLTEIGFEAPDNSDGAWLGGVDLLETLDGPVTPELAALQLDEEAGVVFGSDDPSFLEERADNERGNLDDGVSAVVESAGPALSASAYTGDYACSALSMSEASPADRTRAAELIEAAGEVNPLTGFAIAAQPAGDVRVTMAFDDNAQARANSVSRSALAAGPAPGQGGTFPERFALGEVVANDDVVTMELVPLEDTFVLSDLNQGPVLFATC